MRLLINGAAGKMGLHVIKAAQKSGHFDHIIGVDKYAHQVKLDIPVYVSISDIPTYEKFDCIIDFSTKEALYDILPNASTKQIITTNYIVGTLVVIIGIVLGMFVKDVNTVLQWIVGGLYGGYIAANMFKWYWWRFNANGFFWGMMAGIVPAVALAVLKYFDILSGLDLYYWPGIFLQPYYPQSIHNRQPIHQTEKSELYTRLFPL